MSEITKTNDGWKSSQRDPVDGDVIGIRLIYKTCTLHPSAVRVSTPSAAQDFPYDHDRGSTENAADCVEQWLKFRSELKDWYAKRDQCANAAERSQLPALTLPTEDTL